MSSESNYSFTLKVNGDLFTIRGDSAEQFSENLRNVITEDLLNFIGAVQETVAADGRPTAPAVVKAVFPKTEVTDFPPVDQNFPVAPQPATFTGAPTVPTCDHGARKWNEGISKAGNPYRGWFCQHAVRAEQCKPLYPTTK